VAAGRRQPGDQATAVWDQEPRRAPTVTGVSLLSLLRSADPRRATTARMRSMFEVSRFPQEQYREPAGDAGLFGPRSVTWRIHADPSMIVGGLCALMVQSLHPLAMAGVVDHSDYREAPLRRLSRTASFIGATTFGSTPVAESVIHTVRGVHRRVNGLAPDGRRYSADDPDLLRWVHVAEVASFLRAYRRYGLGFVSLADADRYYDEVAVVAEKLGATEVPRSRADVADYFRAVRPELRATAGALEALAFIRTAPAGSDPLAGAAYEVIVRAAIGVLPAWARRMLGIERPWPLDLAEQALVRPAGWTLLRAIRLATGAPPAFAEARARAEAAAG
jgi:uncharacterized protein (DUF2236 family)